MSKAYEAKRSITLRLPDNASVWEWLVLLNRIPEEYHGLTLQVDRVLTNYGDMHELRVEWMDEL